MTTTEHPFQASAAAANGSQPPSQARLALDNLLRRELKVSDPNDAKAVATALMDRYKTNPRALAIQSEAKGLPLQSAQGSTPIVPVASTSSDSELEQGITDVNRDLEELTTNTILKDITPELQGWASAIRSLIQEGVNAARFALDVTRRDQAFAMRRSLGDYARMARLLGVLTPAMNVNYRKLAQSLDEVASVLLVRMGEALANVSFNGGRFLLQAPYSELQARRDSVIQNLQSLLVSYVMEASNESFNRGLDSYLKLNESLEKQGQGDLRAMLNENELSRSMDSLIQRAAHGNVEGLRALGATAKLDLQRFRRLLAAGHAVNNPISPTFTSFLQSLQLFIDSFGDTGGFRLLWVARPAILFYGLYGSGAKANEAAQRLIDIASRRAALADALDCMAGTLVSGGNQQQQVLLDKILYDIDRAIDLYAMGTQEFGDAEKRASAYGFIIDAYIGKPAVNPNSPLVTLLQEFRNRLLPSVRISFGQGIAETTITTYLGFAKAILDDGRFPDNEYPGLREQLQEIISDIENPVDTTTIQYQSLVKLFGLSSKAMEKNDDLRNHHKHDLRWSLILDDLTPLHSELCLQIKYESQWENLVGSMAPGCTNLQDVTSALTLCLEETRKSVGCQPCTELRIPMPAKNEQNFNAF